MLNAKDFEKWFKENQQSGLKLARFTNPVIPATICYQCGILDGLFEDVDKSDNEKKYDLMNEILGALRTFEPEEIKAIWKYCNDYHYAYQQSDQNHIITEITIESGKNET